MRRVDFVERLFFSRITATSTHSRREPQSRAEAQHGPRSERLLGADRRSRAALGARGRLSDRCLGFGRCGRTRRQGSGRRGRCCRGRGRRRRERALCTRYGERVRLSDPATRITGRKRERESRCAFALVRPFGERFELGIPLVARRLLVLRSERVELGLRDAVHLAGATTTSDRDGFSLFDRSVVEDGSARRRAARIREERVVLGGHGARDDEVVADEACAVGRG